MSGNTGAAARPSAIIPATANPPGSGRAIRSAPQGTPATARVSTRDAHARALLTSSPQGACAYLDADLQDTPKILADAAQTLDFSQPVAVLFVGVLHLVSDDEDPYRIVADVVNVTVPGSYLALTHPAKDINADQVAEGARRYNEHVKVSQTGAPTRRPCGSSIVCRPFPRAWCSATGGGRTPEPPAWRRTCRHGAASPASNSCPASPEPGRRGARRSLTARCRGGAVVSHRLRSKPGHVGVAEGYMHDPGFGVEVDGVLPAFASEPALLHPAERGAQIP